MRSMETAHSQAPALGRSRRSPSRCPWSSASAFPGGERNEPGESDGRGPALSPQASLRLEGAVALLSALRGGSSCRLHAHRGPGSARSAGPAAPRPLRELPGPPRRPPHPPVPSPAPLGMDEIKLTVRANRGPVCLCCGGQGSSSCCRARGVHSAGRAGVEAESRAQEAWHHGQHRHCPEQVAGPLGPQFLWRVRPVPSSPGALSAFARRP